MKKMSAILRSSTAKRLLSTSSYVPVDPKSLNWNTLGFAYVPTKTMMVAQFENGKWNQPTSSSEPYLKIHALSNVSLCRGLVERTAREAS